MQRKFFRIVYLVAVLALALGAVWTTPASAQAVPTGSAGVPAGGATGPDLELGDSSTSSDSDVNAFLAPEAVTPNPDLRPGCGIKMVLVLDASGSIGSTGTPSEQQQVRIAASGFISALLDTGSSVAIVEFAETADTPVPYTAVTAANITNVFDVYLSATNLAGPQYHDGRVGQSTNWDDGFRKVNALPTPPDLVVFMTDGVPNASGTTGAACYPSRSSECGQASANITKANTGNQGFGSHIFAVGVGIVPSDVANLYRVTDGASSVAYTSSPSNFPQADYIIGDFGSLLTDLTNIVKDLCSSSLTVTKQVDEDVRGGAYYLAQADWTFTGSVAPSSGSYSWKSPCTVGSGNCSGPTGANGQVFFQWTPSDTNATSTITIAETQKSDYTFVDAACTVGGTSQSVTQSTTFAVSGITRNGFGACTVRNRRLMDFGDAPSQLWDLVGK